MASQTEAGLFSRAKTLVLFLPESSPLLSAQYMGETAHPLCSMHLLLTVAPWEMPQVLVYPWFQLLGVLGGEVATLSQGRGIQHLVLTQGFWPLCSGSATPGPSWGSSLQGHTWCRVRSPGGVSQAPSACHVGLARSGNLHFTKVAAS